MTINPGESKCKPCKSIELANENHTFCQILHNNTVNIRSLAGISIAILSAIGALIAVFVIVIYIRFCDTPIIKCSSRELSIIQVMSLLVLFCVPIIAYLPVTAYLCILQTLTFGVCLSTVLAIIVVKTYRLLRIFKGGASKVSRFFQEKYQILLVYSFVLIQLTASILWYLFKPLKSKIVINKASLSYHVNCVTNNTITFFIVLCYVFLLALASGYIAFRARKLPENFNEANFICLSMFTACILWLVYVPLHFSLEAVSAVVAFLLVNYVNALAILLILYAYRLYIVLIYPNMNSPEYFRKNVIKFTNITLLMRNCKSEPGNSSSDAAPFIPARQISVTEGYQDTADTFNDTNTFMKSTVERRASSLSSTATTERKILVGEPISFEPFPQPSLRGLIKKFASTPNILDLATTMSLKKNLPHKVSRAPPHVTFSRSTSQIFSQIILSNSLSNIFHFRNNIIPNDESLIKNFHSDQIV